MPDPNAIVSTTIRFDPPLDRPAEDLLRGERGITLQLDADQRVRLNPADARSPAFARLLDELSKQGLPVYLELDPETSFLARLRLPLITRVQSIRAGETENLVVELEGSHALYFLSRAGPDFAAFEPLLVESLNTARPLLVTADDAQNILDVRPLPPGLTAPPPLPKPGFTEDLSPFSGPLRGDEDNCISPERAQQVFDTLMATTCAPLTVPEPCIPFLYPDNGCYTRAHEMCRLMLAQGLSPRKIWITGGLNVATRNKKNCVVRWGWHVAPILCVSTSETAAEDMVLDPSIFTTPVTIDHWKAVMSDPQAKLTESDAEYYYWSALDPDYSRTIQDLAAFRLDLKTRAINDGPPPYANCP